MEACFQSGALLLLPLFYNSKHGISYKNVDIPVTCPALWIGRRQVSFGKLPRERVHRPLDWEGLWQRTSQ